MNEHNWSDSDDGRNDNSISLSTEDNLSFSFLEDRVSLGHNSSSIQGYHDRPMSNLIFVINLLWNHHKEHRQSVNLLQQPLNQSKESLIFLEKYSFWCFFYVSPWASQGVSPITTTRFVGGFFNNFKAARKMSKDFEGKKKLGQEEMLFCSLNSDLGTVLNV